MSLNGRGWLTQLELVGGTKFERKELTNSARVGWWNQVFFGNPPNYLSKHLNIKMTYPLTIGINEFEMHEPWYELTEQESLYIRRVKVKKKKSLWKVIARNIVLFLTKTYF